MSEYTDEMQMLPPGEIESRSMHIITGLLEGMELDSKHEAVIKRVIHTTADFDYVENLWFSPDAVSAGLSALKSGANIVCDTNMVKAGINKAILKSLGGAVYCFMADEDVAEQAKERNITRATVSMEKAARLDEPLIFAVGNAPTALMRLRELIDDGKIKPSLVIGVPVGFVNVVEAKELFVDTGIPSIVARGRKGGSNVAAAICNALLYTVKPRE